MEKSGLMRLSRFAILLVAITSSIFVGFDKARAEGKPASTSFRHERTGLTVPPTLGRSRLLHVQNFEQKHPGAGYGLRFNVPETDSATFFIYGSENEKVPCDVRSAVVVSEFRQSTSAMKTLEERGIYSNVKKLSEGERPLGDLQSSRDALHATYAHTTKGTEMVSQTYLAPFEGHFVKLRLTYKSAKKKAAVKNIKEFLREIDKLLVDHLSKKKRRKVLSVTIKANPEIGGKSKSASAAWLGYALSRAKYVSTNRKKYVWIPGRVKPLFAEDVEARKDSIQIWKEMKDKDASLKDDYFDTMLTVVRAGLLKEYVWSNHRRSYWKMPASLRTKRFKKWAGKKLIKHRPETHGYLLLE